MQSTYNLIEWGECYMGRNFHGVYARNSLPRYLPCGDEFTCFIINTDTNNLPGIHWVAIIIHPYNLRAEYFDSFGRPPISTIKHWLSKHIDKVCYNNIVVQPIDSILCGLYCCYFLFNRLQTVQHLHAIEFILHYFNTKQLHLNDDIVLRFKNMYP